MSYELLLVVDKVQGLRGSSDTQSCHLGGGGTRIKFNGWTRQVQLQEHCWEPAGKHRGSSVMQSWALQDFTGCVRDRYSSQLCTRALEKLGGQDSLWYSLGRVLHALVLWTLDIRHWKTWHKVNGIKCVFCLWLFYLFRRCTDGLIELWQFFFVLSLTFL